MIKIAVCDDVEAELERIKASVEKLCREAKISAEIYSYQKGRELAALIAADKNSFDILLLDIDMPDITGLEVAEALRQAGSEMILIFVSAHEKYVFKSIEYAPFRYIRKSRINTELGPALNAAFSMLNSKNEKTTLIKTENETVLVKHCDIVYIEVSGHYLEVNLKSEDILKTRLPLKVLEGELADDDFVRIHSGCLVNIKYISKFSSFDITLDSGKRLIVSRACLKSVKRKLMEYWRARI